MGSTDSIPQNNSHKLNLHNWQYKYQLEEHPTQYGKYNRLKNKMTGQQLIQYQLYLYDKDQYTQFMSMYELRNRNANIVSISNINKENIKQLCSIIYHLKLYIEDFPLRLCNIKDIPFPQNLYVLDRTLKGFHVLFQNVGHFHLTEDLICINEEGIIKVWFNQDLSKFTPNYSNNHRLQESTTERSKNIENSMVWQLITIVEQLTNRQTVPNGYSFIDFLDSERVSQLDFRKAIHLISLYAQQTEISIPQFFQPVIKIIREKKGIYQSIIEVNNNPRASVRGRDQFNFMMLGNNFKQSKVQRIQSVKNASSKSYVGSESHTFADNLKKFDTSFRKQANAFGKGSYLRESPIEKARNIGKNIQRFTQKLPKKLSYSSFSSPKIQSLNMIDPMFGHRPITYNSNAFSQIIQKPLKQSQIPARVTPPTYFSHIIQPAQHEQLLKKGTLFSFGQQQRPTFSKKSQQNSPMSKQVQSVKSLRYSKLSSDFQKCNKPLVKFTYLVNPNHQQQDHIKKEESIQQNSIPISPPSIDKSSTVKGEKAKQFTQQRKNYFQSRPIKNQQIAQIQIRQSIRNKSQYTQTDPSQFVVNRTISGGKNDYKQVIMQNYLTPYDDKHMKFHRNLNADSKNNYFRNNETQLELQIRNSLPRETSQLNSPFCRPITRVKPNDSEKKASKISFSKKINQKSNKNSYLLPNQLGLDPEIYLDLMHYQQEKLQQEKQQKFKRNRN